MARQTLTKDAHTRARRIAANIATCQPYCSSRYCFFLVDCINDSDNWAVDKCCGRQNDQPERSGHLCQWVVDRGRQPPSGVAADSSSHVPVKLSTLADVADDQ